MCLAPAQDSYIDQNRPTDIHGAESDLKIKPNSGREERIVIRFDLSSIPSNSTVQASTLRLYEDSKKDGQTITLYRLTNSWVESQVSWNNRSSGTPWMIVGGDYNSSPLASFSPNVDKVYRDINVAGVTQSWVSGSFSNHGFLLRSTGSSGEVKFKSRETSTATQRPQLCITYSWIAVSGSPSMSAGTAPNTSSLTDTQPHAASSQVVSVYSGDVEWIRFHRVPGRSASWPHGRRGYT